MARAFTKAANKHKTVFHEEEVLLFFYDGEASHEDSVVFINEEVIHDISYETFEWLLMKSMILLVLHRLFIIWSKLNEIISRHIP